MTAEQDARLARIEAAPYAPESCVERVARAMWEADKVNVCGDDDCCTWEDLDDVDHDMRGRADQYRAMAVAAIDAVKGSGQ